MLFLLPAVPYVGTLSELLFILQNLAQKSPPQEAFPPLFAELVTHSLFGAASVPYFHFTRAANHLPLYSSTQ